jgi:hypothetical protein
MVRLAATLRAKVILALTASDAVQAHMDGRLVRDLISILIFNVKVHLPLLHLHDRATGTFAQVRVRLEELVKFTLCDFVLDSFRQVLSNFSITNNPIADWTMELPKVDPRNSGFFAETVLVYQVEAVVALDHHLLLMLRDLFCTKAAKVGGLFDLVSPLDLLEQLALLFCYRIHVSLILRT